MIGSLTITVVGFAYIWSTSASTLRESHTVHKDGKKASKEAAEVRGRKETAASKGLDDGKAASDDGKPPEKESGQEKSDDKTSGDNVAAKSDETMEGKDSNGEPEPTEKDGLSESDVSDSGDSPTPKN